MADLDKLDRVGAVDALEEEERENLMEGMSVLDFDLLCSTVALQTQGKGRKLDNMDGEDEEDGGENEYGGVLRMWEGDVMDCFEERRVCLESACCPCYRFGKNMKRAGFGSCFIQGLIYLILVVIALLNFVAFVITKRGCFLYLGIAVVLSVGTYLGFFRMQIRKKFNIRGSDSFLDDCIYHLVCPCCTLCQESRTLEMNNIHDGIWHGRGDTICIGSYGEGNRAIFELNPPPIVSSMSSEPYQKSLKTGNES